MQELTFWQTNLVKTMKRINARSNVRKIVTLYVQPSGQPTSIFATLIVPKKPFSFLETAMTADVVPTTNRYAEKMEEPTAMPAGLGASILRSQNKASVKKVRANATQNVLLPSTESVVLKVRLFIIHV